MTFLFFDAAGKALFSRDDAERAENTHQELSFYALFGYDPDKVITHGMRIGYTDSLGVMQVFEIIKCKQYEPDHYQEITAEHICVSELTDELYTAGDITDKTAAQALTAILAGTQWSVGTVTADSHTSSANLSFGEVWQDVRTVEQNWNVYITPRITVSATGITARYLDIAPAEPVARGLRFSLDKNMDDAAVTWDTSRLKTALYGYGKKSMTVSGQSEKQPWTFASVTWTETAEHPAKPSGQTYIEDPAATAAYGRNGRARFGYYQNGDIEDPEKLLELTWETLKTVDVPDVTIEGTVLDLTRLGVADVPIRLHDSALVEIRPTGVTLYKEVIQYTEDLLEPEASRVTIGAYIPNIVYITKENSRTGGGSGGQNDEEYQISEFETEILYNSYEINLRAYQRDMDDVESILRQAGMSLDINGVLVYASDTEKCIQSKLNVQADQISLVVSGTGANAAVNAASIVAAVNNSGSTVTINADKIVLSGETLVQTISGIQGDFTNLTAGTTKATYLRASTVRADALEGLFGGYYYQLKQGEMNVCTGVGSSGVMMIGANTNVSLDHYHGITATEGTGADAGKIILTLGAAQNSAGSANFNIAATQTYIDGVDAAYTQGKEENRGVGTIRFHTQTATNYNAASYPEIVLNSTYYFLEVQSKAGSGGATAWRKVRVSTV